MGAAPLGLEAAPFHAVHLITHLTKADPKWLLIDPRLVAALRSRWHRLVHEP